MPHDMHQSGPSDPMPSATANARCARRRPAGGFTLAELLVVIGIIALLVSILVPVVGSVRIRGQTADTASLIRAIDAACQTYYSDHQAWPGPLSNDQLGVAPAAAPPAVRAGTDDFFRLGTLNDTVSSDPEYGVTGTENLVLGLLGGLVEVDVDSDPTTAPEVQYDPAAFGRGPVKLGGRSPGGYSPYFDAAEPSARMKYVDAEEAVRARVPPAEGLQWGRFSDGVVVASDSIIPEFVDRYSDPMPILYFRSQPAARDAPVADYGAEPVFDLNQIVGYVREQPPAETDPNDPPDYIGIGRQSLSETHAANMRYHGLLPDGELPIPGGTMDQNLRPFAAEHYLRSPNGTGARQADRYGLVSAGPDRVYGTKDDLTNFGAVLP